MAGIFLQRILVSFEIANMDMCIYNMIICISQMELAISAVSVAK